MTTSDVKHKWRRDTAWWDALEVDRDLVKEKYDDRVFDWLSAVAPDPYEHDYILYTDGSGCTAGWGGYAAVWERIELEDEVRKPTHAGVLLTGTYGSTVQRSEFNAFLDGVYAILVDRVGDLLDTAKNDETLAYEIGTKGNLMQVTGPTRVSILWYTDRDNLARSLLHDSEGSPLYSRGKERDLWLRWSFMSKHVCVTPMYNPRNSVPGQAVCDELAGSARSLLKNAVEDLAMKSKNFYKEDLWQKKKPQTALF